MGQGAIQFKDKYLDNCRESHLRNIVLYLEEYLDRIHDDWFHQLLKTWKYQTETMPPGCVNIDLTKSLTSHLEIGKFETILKEIINSLAHNNELPYTHEEAKRILAFLHDTKEP